MKYNYNDEIYDIEIVRKNNKNIYIRVKDNKIVVTCNYLTTKNTINKLINDNISSINKMIDKSNLKKEKEDNFYLFGIKYDVIYGFNNIEINSNKIYVKDKKMLDKYIENKVKETFKNHLDFLYNNYKEEIPIPNLKIRKMTTRWGVCNLKNKNITLNYYLYKYDIECLDYVIIHELSHFIYPNHSKLFWNQVSKYCPNYKKIRKKLKE